MHTPSKSGDIFLSEARDKDATACHGDIADRTTATASATDASQNLIYAPDPDKYRIVPERLIFPCRVIHSQNRARATNFGQNAFPPKRHGLRCGQRRD